MRWPLLATMHAEVEAARGREKKPDSCTTSSAPRRAVFSVPVPCHSRHLVRLRASAATPPQRLCFAADAVHRLSRKTPTSHDSPLASISDLSTQ